MQNTVLLLIFNGGPQEKDDQETTSGIPDAQHVFGAWIHFVGFFLYGHPGSLGRPRRWRGRPGWHPPRRVRARASHG